MFFAAKINEAAKAVGVSVQRFKSPDAMVLNPDQKPSLLIVDLNSQRFDPVEFIKSFKSENEEIRVVGFLSHVQVDLAKRAQEAGCDYVMARSAFNQRLADVVAGNLD